MVALFEVFITKLLAFRKHCLAFADFNCCNAVFRVNSFNGCGNNLAELALELNKSLSLFTGTDSLTNYVSCRRNCDSSKVLCIKRDFNFIADFNPFSFVDFLGVLKRYFKIRVINFVNDCLFKLSVKQILLRVNLEHYALVAAVVILAGNFNCLFNLLEHIIHWNIFFFFKHSQRFKKVLVSHFPNHPLQN